MKTGTQKMDFSVEVKGVPGLILTVSVSARKEMLAALDAVGVTAVELPNYMHTILEEARDAVDGSVRGLIISNLEE
jgi:hypothetical protein